MFCRKSWNLQLFKTLERYEMFVFCLCLFAIKLSNICGPYQQKTSIMDLKIVETVVLVGLPGWA